MYAFAISLILFFYNTCTYTNDCDTQVAMEDKKNSFNALQGLNSILKKDLSKAEEVQDLEKIEKIKRILTILDNAQNDSSLEQPKNDNKTLYIALSKGSTEYNGLDSAEKIMHMIALCACGIPVTIMFWKLMFEALKITL